LGTRKQILAPVFSRPRDFFLWGYAKEHVFVPPLPLDVDEVKLRITAVIETVDGNMLARVWHELEQRLDTNGAHIEHLQGM
jgi:hypothetical protein